MNERNNYITTRLTNRRITAIKKYITKYLHKERKEVTT